MLLLNTVSFLNDNMEITVAVKNNCGSMYSLKVHPRQIYYGQQ